MEVRVAVHQGLTDSPWDCWFLDATGVGAGRFSSFMKDGKGGDRFLESRKFQKHQQSLDDLFPDNASLEALGGPLTYGEIIPTSSSAVFAALGLSKTQAKVLTRLLEKVPADAPPSERQSTGEIAVSAKL